MHVTKSHLSDVDDLGGSVPDAVDTQKLQGLRVEDELEKPVRPPEHLTLRELLIVRETDLRHDEDRQSGGGIVM